jgi:hypothetical protein
MTRNAIVSLFCLATWAAPALVLGEVVYLNNGDVIHGTLVAANNTEVTLKTPFGQLVIPKEQIESIDYQGTDESRPEAKDAGKNSDAPDRKPRVAPGGRASIVLSITGRSFWYAFESPPDRPADTSIRLRLYVGSARACTFVDDKPDTSDGNTLYNSFTFSPTDSKLLESLEGYDCGVEKAENGAVVLRVVLPPEVSQGVNGRVTVRMLYEVNEGDRSFPRWVDAVSRTFSLEVAPGKEAVAKLEQNASALEYSGFFKKQMKNLELFQLSLLSTELKD